MTRFTVENTDYHYTNKALADLNEAWAEITSYGAPNDPDDIASRSMLDHWAEALLDAYDNGKRGSQLTAWFYHE